MYSPTDISPLPLPPLTLICVRSSLQDWGTQTHASIHDTKWNGSNFWISKYVMVSHGSYINSYSICSLPSALTPSNFIVYWLLSWVFIYPKLILDLLTTSHTDTWLDRECHCSSRQHWKLPIRHYHEAFCTISRSRPVLAEGAEHKLKPAQRMSVFNSAIPWTADVTNLGRFRSIFVTPFHLHPFGCALPSTLGVEIWLALHREWHYSSEPENFSFHTNIGRFFTHYF